MNGENVMLVSPDGGRLVVPDGCRERPWMAHGFEYETVPDRLLFHPGDPLYDNSWLGATCYVVGCGPSLKGFDFERLRGSKVIAAGRSVVDLPFSQVAVTADSRTIEYLAAGAFGETERALYADYQGIKLHVNTDWRRRASDIREVQPYGDGESLSPSIAMGLGICGNTGFAAINLALILGCSTVHLLGFDMKDAVDGEGDHYCPDPEVLGVCGTYSTYVPRITRAVESMSSIWPCARVINTNTDSGLKCFEFGMLPV